MQWNEFFLRSKRSILCITVPCVERSSFVRRIQGRIFDGMWTALQWQGVCHGIDARQARTAEPSMLGAVQDSPQFFTIGGQHSFALGSWSWAV